MLVLLADLGWHNMKLYDLTIPIILIVVGISAVVGYFSTKFLGPDNPVEQIAEEVIDAETGIKVDLSPESK